MWPLLRSSLMMAEPTKPEAPVRKTRILGRVKVVDGKFWKVFDGMM